MERKPRAGKDFIGRVRDNFLFLVNNHKDWVFDLIIDGPPLYAFSNETCQKLVLRAEAYDCTNVTYFWEKEDFNRVISFDELVEVVCELQAIADRPNKPTKVKDVFEFWKIENEIYFQDKHQAWDVVTDFMSCLISLFESRKVAA